MGDYWLGRFRLAASVFLLSALLSCADAVRVPVVERVQPPSEKINYHWVSRDETLYAIAWRYNMETSQLALANGLRPPYKIWAGQKLSLVAPKRWRQASSRYGKEHGRFSVSTGDTKIDTARVESVSKLKSSSTSPKDRGITSVGHWGWPAKGNILRPYSKVRNKVHKGLDIKGRNGQAVMAANNGVVVYAGSGLPAYGNLLIIKHNELYLSAYAYNSKLVVVEGERVKVGQKIAEMGRSGTTHEHLHFEVRKKGVPIDPLKVLPHV